MSLEFRDISKNVLGEAHIFPISLKLHPEAFNVLLGPTLSGKTSLMRLMAGLDKPSSGAVFFKGKDTTRVPIQKRNLAMVYQQFINFPGMSVYENIASPLRVKRLAEGEVRQRVGKVSELLKLTPYLNRRPSELSGGQQQRTALARALVKEAELVLLDEPLVNLDYKLREELREELPRLFSDTGATVVYATTEPTEALLLGGFTATLREGRVTQYGPTHEVFRQPLDLETARAFSDPPLNTIVLEKRGDAFLRENRDPIPLSPYQSVPEGRFTLGFRPHHLRMSSAGGEEIRLSGEVLITEISGSESFIHMKSGDHTWVAHTQGIHHFSPGDPIEMFVSSAQCLLFDAAEQRLSMGA
jgi:glycerol transport system ATP-binding protein